MLQLFPLISDVTMSDKYLDPQESSSKKLIPMTSLEMRKVLEDVEDERAEDLEDEEEQSEFSRVLAEMPDLEVDYGDLSLGFNEELCFGPATGDDGQSKSVSVTTERKDVEPTERMEDTEVSEDITMTEKGEVEVLAAQAASQAVPIHKGDLIEFMISDRTWFLVEVTARGKLGGKNQNYLNVKYSDGSEGGVYIDKHQWRIVKRKEVGLEDSTDQSTILPTLKVTVDLPAQEETETTTDTDDCGLTEQDKQKVGHTRKRKRSRRKRDKERKGSVEESGGEAANSISSIKRGDRIEYVVKEQDGKVRQGVVEALNKGSQSRKKLQKNNL